MGKLKVVVIYDRVLVDEAEEAAADKGPVVRTLDKKDVEEADNWVQKALATKKIKAERKPQAGGITTESK